MHHLPILFISGEALAKKSEAFLCASDSLHQSRRGLVLYYTYLEAERRAEVPKSSWLFAKLWSLRSVVRTVCILNERERESSIKKGTTDPVLEFHFAYSLFSASSSVMSFGTRKEKGDSGASLVPGDTSIHLLSA